MKFNRYKLKRGRFMAILPIMWLITILDMASKRLWYYVPNHVMMIVCYLFIFLYKPDRKIWRYSYYLLFLVMIGLILAYSFYVDPGPYSKTAANITYIVTTIILIFFRNEGPMDQRARAVQTQLADPE